MNPARRRLVTILASALLAIAIGLALGWYLQGDNQEIRSGSISSSGTASIGGAFSLTDQQGQPASDQDFAGKYLIVYFGFTNCVDACPLALLAISQALDRLPPEIVEEVQPIFITVDPARDDVEQIARYLENFHPKFVGLTGTEEQIGAAAKAYRAVYEPPKPDENGDYQVQHGTLIYLMAPDGTYLAHFDHLSSAAKIAESLEKYVGGGA